MQGVIEKHALTHGPVSPKQLVHPVCGSAYSLELHPNWQCRCKSLWALMFLDTCTLIVLAKSRVVRQFRITYELALRETTITTLLDGPPPEARTLWWRSMDFFFWCFVQADRHPLRVQGFPNRGFLPKYMGSELRIARLPFACFSWRDREIGRLKHEPRKTCAIILLYHVKTINFKGFLGLK